MTLLIPFMIVGAGMSPSDPSLKDLVPNKGVSGVIEPL